MTTISDYREIAEECREAMRGTTSPEVRAELLRLAFRCEELADEIEQRRHRTVSDLLTPDRPAYYASAFR